MTQEISSVSFKFTSIIILLFIHFYASLFYKYIFITLRKYVKLTYNIKYICKKKKKRYI